MCFWKVWVELAALALLSIFMQVRKKVENKDCWGNGRDNDNSNLGLEFTIGYAWNI